VRTLLAAGAEVNTRAADGWTALEAAEMIGDEVTLAILRDAKSREESP
jgi:ankyrin repeat protein